MYYNVINIFRESCVFRFYSPSCSSVCACESMFAFLLFCSVFLVFFRVSFVFLINGVDFVIVGVVVVVAVIGGGIGANCVYLFIFRSFVFSLSIFRFIFASTSFFFFWCINLRSNKDLNL